MLVVVDHRKCAGGKLALKVETQFLSLPSGSQSPFQAAQDPLTTPFPPPLAAQSGATFALPGQRATEPLSAAVRLARAGKQLPRAWHHWGLTRREGRTSKQIIENLGPRRQDKGNQPCHCSTTLQGTHNVFFFGRRQEGSAPGKPATSLFQGSRHGLY
jgi:hypothetical protein